MLRITNVFEDADLPTLYEIEKKCFTWDFRWIPSVFTRTMLEARQTRMVWVAYMGKRIAGYLLAGKELGKFSIETVNIAPAYRRKGIASKLISTCEQCAKERGFKAVKLKVWTENPAQILYFNLGYRVNGFKRNYYQADFHAITMSKKL